jgi:hypothetical protein
MKKTFVIFLAILSGALVSAQTTSNLEKQALDAKLNNIGARVDAGDYSAFSEATKLPTATALRFLYILYDRRAKSDTRRDEAAIEAMRNVPGYADYLRQDMAKIVAQGGIPGADFKILETIDTPEAAAVAAPYLFDPRLITLNKGEPPDTIAGWAETILKRMNLPDAPKLGLQTPNSVVLVEWQKWAIAKGYVPKDWSSRVGAPAWLLKMDAWRPPTPTPLPTRPPQQNQPGSSPLPPTAISPAPAKAPSTSAGIPSAVTKKAPEFVQTENGARAPVILLIAGLALIVIAGTVAWKWQKK